MIPKRVLALAVACSIFAAVAPSAQAAVIKLDFWHPWGTGAMSKALDELLLKFNNEHPSIKVVPQLVPVNELDQKVLLAVAAGAGPDIAWGWPGLLGQSGSFIADMAPLIQMEKGKLSDVFARYWDSAKVKNQVLGFPIEANGEAVAYNLDLLAAAGVKPPKDGWNWDDFTATAQRLTLDKNGDGKPEQWGWSSFLDASDPWSFLPYLWQAGGEMLDDDHTPTKVTLDSKEAVEALRYMVDLGNKWHVTVPSFGAGGIASKKVAMETAGAWSVGDWMKVKNLKIDSVVLPRYRHDANIMLAADLYIIKKKPERQKAAWEFIKWFCSPEINSRWALNTGYLPIRKKAMSSPDYAAFVKNTPVVRGFVDGMDVARSRPFWLPVYNRLARSLGRQVSKALSQTCSPEQSMQVAKAEMTAILATLKKR